MTSTLLLMLTLVSTGAHVSGQQIWFTLESTTITTNNTEILITDIGEDAGDLPLLTCNTDGVCCRSVAENGGMGALGQWTDPDGSEILRNGLSGDAGDQFYIVRNAPQVIRLARRQANKPLTPTGSYCCTVPTTEGEMTLCANLVVCTSLPPLTDGVISYSDPTLGENTMATHTCEAGSALTTDLTTRTCGVTSSGVGVWSGSPLVCAVVDCGAPPNISDGSIAVGTTTFGEMATYTCTSGFSISGSATITCQANGSWEPEPACTMDPIDCGTPPSISNGSPGAPSPDTMLNGVVTYTCVSGYEVSTGVTTAIATCMASGMWETVPTCSLVDCGAPPTISDGSIAVGTTTFGETTTYTCTSGFSISGSATITCQANGSWEPEPACTMDPIDCGTPTSISNGSPGTPSNTMLNGVVTYTCDTGYEVSTGVTTAMATCMASGMWETLPTCSPVDCGVPPSVSNGSPGAPSPDTTLGGIVTYTCTSGVLVGGATVTCEASGDWSTPPTCLVVTVMSTATPTAGLNYSLTCTAELSTTATPIFQWFQDGSVITVGGTRNIVGGEETPSPYTNTLTFTPIQQSHQGAYICRVTVDTVTANSPSTDVTVGVPTLMATLTLAPSPMAGQSYSLTCTLTGGESLNPTISYQFTQDNPGQTGVVGGVLTTPTLTFNPLMLSNSGQYSCQATITSPHLNNPQVLNSGTQDLMIQVPTPNVSIVDPGNLFATTSLTLMCSVSVDSSVVDVPVSGSVEWDGPRGMGFFSVSGALSGGSTTLSVPLTNAVTTDSGNYTCRASVSTTTAYPQVSPSGEGSGSRSITVYGVPSAPSVTVTDSTTTTLTFSWTQPPNELVTTYTLNLDYRGDCPDQTPNTMNLDGDTTAVTFGSIFDLEEFSDYQLTITGTNGAGTSSPVLETATTLPATPDDPVQNLIVNTSRSNPISITIQWDRVPCIDRNSNITGYTVVYTPPTTMNTVSGTDTREFSVSVFPRTMYTFQVRPIFTGSGTAPRQTTSHLTAPVTDVSFLVNGELIPDNSIIRPDQFGEGLAALHCLTPYEDCCRLSDTVGPVGAGQWLTPTGDNVAFSNSMLYMSCNPSRVSLNRDSLTPATGIYRCLIPVSESSDQTIHIGLYPEGQGAPTIPDELVFNRADLTLTCVSNGGPASEVVWTRDGATVSTGYTLTQTVSYITTTSYENVLTATTIADLVGNFTCTVSNSRGTSAQSIPISGVRIIDPPQLTVGQSATLTCESDVPGTIEWLDSDMSVLATRNGSELDYTISLVSDGMHGSTLTCRAPGGSEVITFIVIVPPDILDFTITPVGSPTAGSEYSLRCEVSLSIIGIVNPPTAVWTATDNDFSVISSGDASTLTFSPLRTSHGRAGYTCVGQLESPALDQVMEDQTQRDVMVTIPIPGVSLTTPTSLTAGTPSSLTCTITVDTAVDLNVVVDYVWEISTDSDPVNSTTTTGSNSVQDTLTIPILSTRYTGVTCRAMVRRSFTDLFVLSSSQGSAFVAISVEVPPPPVVTISVSGDSVAGSSLSLLCIATPTIPLVTPPTISWIQQDLANIVTPVTSDPSASVNLTFDPLRTSRGGMYMCMAGYNISDADLPDLSNNASTIVSVQIPRPGARITFDPMMDNYTVGLSLTLGCEVSLSSAVDTMVNLDPIWRREGIVLTTGDQLTVGDFPMTSDDQVYTSLLEFQPLTRDFIGNDTLYECEASVVPQSDAFITGTTTNTSTTLTVGEADFSASISSNSTMLAGSEHTLVCQGVRGDDQADGTTLEVEWFNPDGVLITGETSDVMITGVTDITTNATLMSSLIFPSLQTSQAGPYTCRVNHTIPDTTITDQSILSSSVVTVQINTPQVMINASRSATLYEGTTGQVLRCVVTPDNTGVDTTTNVTRDITGGVDRATTSDSVSDGVIIVEEAIQVLSLSDTGTYTCTATVDSEPNNIYIMSANNTDTLSITVEVLPVPVVEISASSPLPVLAGSSLNLTCSVSVEDLLSVEPLVQWTLSDQPLSGVLNGRTNTLTFDPLLTTNATQYTCTATINIPAVNITSTGSNSTDLTVNIPPPTVSVSSPTPVYHGTNHTLSCNAGYDTSVVTTAVTLDYSWTGPNLIASSDSAALTLSPVDLPAQSSGDYTCTVSVIPADSTFINPATDFDTYNLTVLDAPPPEVLTGVPVREERCGQVSSITCTASVIDNFVATPTFMWRGPGGDIVDSDNILNLASVMTGGEYTCMACVNVPQVNIIDLCTNSTITIQNTPPQPVSDVECSSLSPSTLSVSWSPPTDPVLSYQVEVKEYSKVAVGNIVDMFDSEDIITNTTVESLVPSTRYLVSVEAVSGVGCSDVTEIDCYTEQTQPPVVTGVTADRLNGTAMNVSWTPLNKALSNGFIDNYIVRYSVAMPTPNRKRQGSEQVTVPSDKSSTIIGGLDPGSEYSVGVSASGTGGTSRFSEPIVAPTPPLDGNDLPLIIGAVVVVLVLIVAITITIIVIVCLVKRHQARDKYRLKTDRNFELASMGPTTTIEPTTATAHHPLGGDELEHAESEKAKEALNGAEEVVAVATVTPAEVLDRLNPVSLTSFRSHVQNMHDDRAKGFEAEYQSFSMDPLEAHEEAKIPHNRLKNRFANIYPYDHSRVLLNAVPGVAGSEYINACWLEGYQRPKAYIAAQGPMPTSLDDFWRMIWEYKLANIVMLTRCKEGGRVKCEQYWAEDIGGVFETENKSVSVTTLSVTTYADFVIRQFTVKNNHQAGSEPLKVTQFHFTAWPDHGVPKFATSLISFIRKTQRVHNKESGVPLLVHCSAGVGRTGTFITLDAMLERIHSETSVNVYAFVKAMRKNRVLMVQTLAQYSFIHDALDELITCGETDIPAGALRTKVNLLSKVIPGKGITGFTNQFQLLEEVSRVPDPEDVNDANEHFNKDKNRYPDRVPYNMSRARLRPSGEDGSEYINASFIDGYKQRNAYIAAQGPLRNTVDDFWRMIWEFKSKTVAMVCNSEEGGQESAAPYWPPKEDEPVLYGKITVTLQAKAAYGDFTVRKFTIQEEKAANGKQMDGFTVTLFHHTEWPLDGRPKTGTLIEMLDMITKSQMSTGNRPITVMCNDGVGRTGTFICIHAQLERLKTEGVVDFFQSIKLARIQRAGLVPDVTNYAFCHEVLADFIDKFDNYANFKDMI